MEGKKIEEWTVAQLKKYLQGRAIQVSGYYKAALQMMVQKAVRNPDLTEVMEESDNAEVAIKRRKLEINGEVVIFPDPLSLTS